MTQAKVRGVGQTDWTPLVHRWGAAWESDVTPTPPLDLQIVGQQGQQVCYRGHNEVAKSGGHAMQGT